MTPKARFEREIEDKRFGLLCDDDGVGKARLMAIGRAAFVAGWVARETTMFSLSNPSRPNLSVLRRLARRAWEGK